MLVSSSHAVERCDALGVGTLEELLHLVDLAFSTPSQLVDTVSQVRNHANMGQHLSIVVERDVEVARHSVHSEESFDVAAFSLSKCLLGLFDHLGVGVWYPL